MNVYFATQLQNSKFLVDEGVKNVLISFAFCNKPQQLVDSFEGNFPKKLIIDSGAFSVWTKGQTIDIDKYIQYCKDLRKILPSEVEMNVVNLDVLPGRFGIRPTQAEREESAVKGWENMLYMESKGLKVIHVFHQHESFEWLDKIRSHLDYIGISPANDVSMNEKLNWLNQVFKTIRNTVKTHGFAVTSPTQLKAYPFYSVDSSSWTAGVRYARIPVMHGSTSTTFSFKDRNSILTAWPLISKIDPNDLNKKETQYRIAIHSYLEMEKYMTDLWSKRGITWD